MRSEAQKKADKKYRQKKLSDGTKKQINATLDTEIYNMFDNYCKDNEISKASFITNAIKYCIENNINLKNE